MPDETTREESEKSPEESRHGDSRAGVLKSMPNILENLVASLNKEVRPFS